MVPLVLTHSHTARIVHWQKQVSALALGLHDLPRQAQTESLCSLAGTRIPPDLHWHGPCKKARQEWGLPTHWSGSSRQAEIDQGLYVKPTSTVYPPKWHLGLGQVPSRLPLKHKPKGYALKRGQPNP